jgi:signal transduction histidine kinase
MGTRIRKAFNRLSLARRFMLASFVILVAGMFSTAAWVGDQIEQGVIHRTAATTAVYVDSILSPNLQELATHGDALSPEHVDTLNHLLTDTSFGQRIAAFKVWNKWGQIVYSADPQLIGQSFPVQGGLATALQGEVAARISDLEDAENASERVKQSQLLEMYSPVRRGGTDEVIGAAEFYYPVADLDNEINMAQWRTWLVFGTATVLMYLLLAVFVQQASNTISRQGTALNAQVIRLTALLAQNRELDERVRRAAARTTALNERFLRRVSAELHDGPAQDLGLALLRLDHVIDHRERPGVAPAHTNGHGAPDDLDVIQTSLRRAMEEVRAISSGLGVPQLEQWTLAEIVSRVVSTHERRTGTQVAVQVACADTTAPLPVKITLYRLIQEGLNNAHRHADGAAQGVVVRCAGDDLEVEVTDQGPGFDPAALSPTSDHLGLSGMRERVESLGGVFHIESMAGEGTRVMAHFPLAAKGDNER